MDLFGSADAVGRLLGERILEDLGCVAGARVVVLVNGSGATPPLELYLVYRGARAVLAERGMEIVHTYVGEFITSLQMAGLSLTVTQVDDEIVGLLRQPARSVGFVQ